MTDPGKRWSAGEAEEILRRAVELQDREGGSDPSYSDTDLERLGAEIGLSPLAVRRAMVELRTERQAKPSQLPDTLDHWFGPRWFVAFRSVPGPRRAVAEIVAKTMQEQLFRVQRNFGNTVVFVSGSAWMEPVRRALEVEKRHYLPLAEVVMVTVTDAIHRPNWVDIRIEVGMPSARRARLQTAALALGLWGAAVPLVAALLVGTPAGLAVMLGGLAFGTGLANHERRRYTQERLGLRANMERLLDYLEHERLS